MVTSIVSSLGGGSGLHTRRAKAGRQEGDVTTAKLRAAATARLADSGAVARKRVSA